MENREHQGHHHHIHHGSAQGEVCRPVHFVVNHHPHESLDHTLTGAQIKQIDKVPLTDELFLDGPCGDEVVPNDATVLVRDGDKFHTMPSPHYGNGLSPELSVQVNAVLAVYQGEFIERDAQDRRLLLRSVPLPPGYATQKVDLLIRVPPLFPEARPDMFWARPALVLADGRQPQASSLEQIDAESWQRFSWHLAADAWQPGVSTLRDFVRAVIARLHRVN